LNYKNLLLVLLQSYAYSSNMKIKLYEQQDQSYLMWNDAIGQRV
jgi:hypothetical protein